MIEKYKSGKSERLDLKFEYNFVLILFHHAARNCKLKRNLLKLEDKY